MEGAGGRSKAEKSIVIYAVDVIYLRGKFETREGVRDENKIVPLASVKIYESLLLLGLNRVIITLTLILFTLSCDFCTTTHLEYLRSLSLS